MKSHEAAPDEDQPKAKNPQITQMDADRGLKSRSGALIKRAKARKAPVECLRKMAAPTPPVRFSICVNLRNLRIPLGKLASIFYGFLRLMTS
jgi:hypothetical protein